MTEAAAQSNTSGSDRRVTDLMAVLEVTRQLGATTDLQLLLESIERSALQVLDCERGSVFVFDSAKNELFSRVATGTGEIRFPANRGISGQSFQTGAVINVPDAYADDRFNPEIDRKTGFRTRNILVCPLIGYDNSPIGVLQVLNKRQGGFEAWDEELIRTLGAQTGVAVQRAMLLMEFAEKQRIENDLNIARNIQQSIIPKNAPQIPGFEIAGWNQPADKTGGDFFDFQKLPDGQWAIMLADVTGHGIGPALVVAECRALMRATLSVTQALANVVTQVNDLLCADLPDNLFVTCFAGLLHPTDARLTYLSAGHGPLLFFHTAKNEVSELHIDGCPLGILKRFKYGPAREIVFEPGDIALFLTDGFFEWFNPQREQYGIDRIKDFVRANPHLAAAEMLQQLYQQVLTFAEGVPQKDDLTAVIIKFQPAPMPV